MGYGHRLSAHVSHSCRKVSTLVLSSSLIGLATDAEDSDRFATEDSATPFDAVAAAKSDVRPYPATCIDAERRVAGCHTSSSMVAHWCITKLVVDREYHDAVEHGAQFTPRTGHAGTDGRMGREHMVQVACARRDGGN